MGDFFNEGLYEVQAQLRGIPLLDSRPKQVMRNMSAKDACKNQKVWSSYIYLSGIEKYILYQ